MVGSNWKSLIALSLGAVLLGLPTASFAVVPISPEFAVIASGGTITVTNNSGTAAYPESFYIFGLGIGIPNSYNPNNNLGWNDFASNPGTPSASLTYINPNYLSLGTDIGPNSSSSGLTYFDPPSLQIFTLDLVNPDGQLFTYSFNGATGTLTPGVPEPSTWAMMLIGFAGLGYAGCRRAKRNPSAIA